MATIIISVQEPEAPYFNTEKGNDVMYGGAGDNILHDRKGQDTVIGDRGNDTVYGDDGFDELIGVNFTSRFAGRAKVVTLISDIGPNFFIDNTGADRFI